MVLAAALVAATPTQVVALFGFEQLLEDQPRHRVDEVRDDIGAGLGAAVEQRVEVLADEHGRGYSPHWPGPPC